jgi:hypothetical protein
MIIRAGRSGFFVFTIYGVYNLLSDAGAADRTCIKWSNEDARVSSIAGDAHAAHGASWHVENCGFPRRSNEHRKMAQNPPRLARHELEVQSPLNAAMIVSEHTQLLMPMTKTKAS